VKITDFKRLKKLMMMTLSDSDNEALMSLRQANKILTGYGIDWDRVLDKTVTVVNEVEEGPDDLSDYPARDKGRQDDEVDEAFTYLGQGRTSSFIESLHDQWERKRWLSPAQRDALFKTVERERRIR